jgi:hypothetical protein
MARDRGPESVESILACGEFTADGTADVHDVAVSFHVHDLLQFHAA